MFIVTLVMSVSYPTQKWKPVLLSLFPPSSSGVGRLEIQDVGGRLAASLTPKGILALQYIHMKHYYFNVGQC